MRNIAAIARSPGQAFDVVDTEIDAPRADEILVRIVGVGICHTDLAVRDQHMPLPLPMVLGHEGAGIVEAVGEAVTKVGIGDHVVLTFRSCGLCSNCRRGQPAYCLQFGQLNGSGRRLDGSCSIHQGGEEISCNFFGQSSFGVFALAYERNTIKVTKAVPLELLGPFGCGIQTGAGGVMRSLRCRAGSSLLVLGGGTVGLSAVMAAVVEGCATIIVSEPSESRRALALELGATHVIDPRSDDLATAIAAIMPDGLDYVFDTSGRAEAITAAASALGPLGALGLVGIPADPTTAFTSNLYSLIARGLTVRGIVEGDSDPDIFIPDLIELYRQGRFPVDKLIRTYPLSRINEAVHDQSVFECVKAVLLPEQPSLA